ncbi:MFS transporter [Alteromonas halophila]|uniref:MFS transporter n=1 Tax=Alteromonas halophila TaxID=516698 RepID=A0A918N0L0_9ALTE|nr:MFS transporter [Alteromonas halophila]GGW93807.1 hypothetical protein GCM10007391_30130 [Alteromonas halophila]
MTFFATWALGGFMQAYGPSIAASQLGTLSVFVAAIVFSSFLLPGALGGPLTGRLTPAQAQRWGMTVFTFAVIGIIASMKLSSVTMFIVASAIAGAAQGAVLTGSVRVLMTDVRQQDRAGVLSLIFATSYTGAAIPSLIAGQLSKFISLFELSLFYAGLAIVVWLVTICFAKDPAVTAHRSRAVSE